MSYEDRHCPFLNRNDARCAERFTVGHMQHAFRYCFEHYKACPTYLELLVERRVRRVSQNAVIHHAVEPSPSLIQITVAGKAAA